MAVIDSYIDQPSPTDGDLYQAAAADRLGFWAQQANRLSWSTPFTQVLDYSDAPFARWFADGRLNVAYNCVDRHVEAGHGDRVAIFFEGEPGDARSITYAELLAQVSQAANTLTGLGLVAGDRVAIYLPMIPEAIVAMLACARLGIMHTVVFAGFSAHALRDRINDAQAKVVITADGQHRRGASAPLKPAVDEALSAAPSVQHVLVVRRTGDDITFTTGRDLWWHDTVATAPTTHTPASFEAEQPLFLLYTSGTTGKPKGIVHTCGGYLTQAAYTHSVVFDLKPESDVFWCTADIGWVTGHTYAVYGPLANGATQVIYEGTPDHPSQHRHFEIIEKFGVTTYYTAPTLIRTFMKWGRAVPDAHDLSSLRLLGSVGEPINPEAWRWYRSVIGGDTLPVVDTWWQTETGATMITPLPGTAAKPGAAMTPLPGISAMVVDDDGNPLTPDADAAGPGAGYLVIDQPWPAMARGIWGDRQRFIDTYWSRFAEQGWYFAGDGARYDADGHIWVLGRIDDVMNVSGHRISTAEVESALVSHPAVAEAAVVGATDEQTGQGICAFVVLAAGHGHHVDSMVDELRTRVAEQISPIARPKQIHVIPELPKTRSGKIIRRLLRDIADGRQLGDTSTLVDPGVFDAIRTTG
ncbi:acetate--CoA ligase [Mycobacterium sp. M1]|uniref:Acetate--CoA ligase n=1 Tax=Mycolicibacter acidiphilus TaxID=2835306 RepID=A0ABS5RHU2_9MYCO|nr:acetate--CoA ligase [Mycolicibacter acidiphilus]MBS9533831.1 acetate--CoA ligase [Mycolicibacter acidiphilus]